MKADQTAVAAVPKLATKKPTEPSDAPKKDRSPNYPMLTFTDALAKARQIYEKEGTHQMNTDLAVKHIGLVLNGRTRMMVAAMKHYGLLVSVGAQVKVTDDAKAIFVYPESEPKRGEIMRRLAMLPQVFQQLRAHFPESLPSDENIAATLQMDMGFTKEACPTVIKVFRHALGVSGVDGSADSADTGDEPAPEDAIMTGNKPGLEALKPPPPPPPGGRTTTTVSPPNSWNLGGGVWAQMTISGPLTAKRLEKLKGFVGLLDPEEETGDQK